MTGHEPTGFQVTRTWGAWGFRRVYVLRASLQNQQTTYCSFDWAAASRRLAPQLPLCSQENGLRWMKKFTQDHTAKKRPSWKFPGDVGRRPPRWHGSHPWPGNLHMPWVWPKREKKKTEQVDWRTSVPCKGSEEVCICILVTCFALKTFS